MSWEVEFGCEGLEMIGCREVPCGSSEDKRRDFPEPVLPKNEIRLIESVALGPWNKSLRNAPFAILKQENESTSIIKQFKITLVVPKRNRIDSAKQPLS
jgi:hypothetical protein